VSAIGVTAADASVPKQSPLDHERAPAKLLDWQIGGTPNSNG
jgi:hypothetical protein